ncbi:DUF6114 domain-containing protein [Streptacidiphilus sp. EB129]|uniref:DUF6114 domain-containing protein n=1 Tax=Streptacidiphilus sp. EB129 TaxID=3156262 RepID=UPI003514FFA5
MTSATAQARPEPGTGFSKARRAFRNWRRSRPFWGGLLVLLAGFPILYFPYASLNVSGLRIQLSTTAGAGALIIGLLLISLGISVWFQPLVRVFAGIAAIVLSLVSLPMANFGGFGLGLIPGLLGGALVCSWAPLKAPRNAESVADPVAETRLTELMAEETAAPRAAAQNEAGAAHAADGGEATSDGQ